VAREDCRQGLDDVFYALVRREQAKREQNFFAFGSEGILIEVGVGEGQVRNTVWNQIDLGGRDVEHFLQNFG